jgi:hypothetical protein
MGARALKHTNEAMAFITLFKTMRPEIKEEVRQMIADESEDSEIEKFTTISLQSWDMDDDGANESNIWEKFYNERKKL